MESRRSDREIYHYSLDVLELVVDGVDVASSIGQLLLGLLDVHVEFNKSVRPGHRIDFAAVVLVEFLGNILQIREGHSL